MRHRLFLHLVWTTRRRVPMIDAPMAAFLERFLPAVAAQERARAVALGVVSTHVHLLLRVHPLVRLSRMVQRLKGGSIVVARREGIAPGAIPLRWARGYNLESVSPRALERVSTYVLTQASHHPDQAITSWTPAIDWHGPPDLRPDGA
jgi:REP element-mobilizing transposase RayT